MPYITYVEFDEQGEMHRRSLARLALQKISQRASERQTVILLFAHGWKHNASSYDQNVVEFQKQLVKLANRINAVSKKPTNVEGVYLGWRGLSLKPPVLKESTFWARKRAAARIGLDGASKVIAELAAIRTKRPTDNGRHTLVLTGHSFGGALLYSASSQMLLRELVQAQECVKPKSTKSNQTVAVRPFSTTSISVQPDGIAPIPNENTSCHQLSASVADLVVLINPAIEQARFTPIERRANDSTFREGQKPVFAVFMSRDDLPTKRLFPLGRWASTIFNLYTNNDQKKRDISAMGHLEHHWTHSLEFPSKAPPSVDNPYSPFFEEINGPALKWDQYICGKTNAWTAGSGTLTRIHGKKPFSPYMIVSVDGDGISSHNDIWGDQFTEFVERFIVSGVLRPEVNCDYVPPPLKIPNDN